MMAMTRSVQGRQRGQQQQHVPCFRFHGSFLYFQRLPAALILLILVAIQFNVLIESINGINESHYYSQNAGTVPIDTRDRSATAAAASTASNPSSNKHFWWEEYVDSIARPYPNWSKHYNHTTKYAWCTTSSGEPPQNGLLLAKTFKTGSSTAAGINMRIASKVGKRVQQQQKLQYDHLSNNNHHQRCPSQDDHPYSLRNHQIHRNKSHSILWTIVRNPASRAVSSYFFYRMGYRKESYNQSELLFFLQVSKNNQLIQLRNDPAKELIQPMLGIFRPSTAEPLVQLQQPKELREAQYHRCREYQERLKLRRQRRKNRLEQYMQLRRQRPQRLQPQRLQERRQPQQIQQIRQQQQQPQRQIQQRLLFVTQQGPVLTNNHSQEEQKDDDEWQDASKRKDYIAHIVRTQVFENNTYDFIAVMERMEESLVVMTFLFDLELEDLITFGTKSSGTWTWDWDPLTTTSCFFIPSKHEQLSYVMHGSKSSSSSNSTTTTTTTGTSTSPIQNYLKHDFLQDNGDYLLYAAANRSLDLTIEKIGRSKVEKELKRYREMKDLVERQCQGKAIFPCSEDGQWQMLPFQIVTGVTWDVDILV